MMLNVRTARMLAAAALLAITGGLACETRADGDEPDSPVRSDRGVGVVELG